MASKFTFDEQEIGNENIYERECNTPTRYYDEVKFRDSMGESLIDFDIGRPQYTENYQPIIGQEEGQKKVDETELTDRNQQVAADHVISGVVDESLENTYATSKTVINNAKNAGVYNNTNKNSGNMPTWAKNPNNMYTPVANNVPIPQYPWSAYSPMGPTQGYPQYNSPPFFSAPVIPQPREVQFVSANPLSLVQTFEWRSEDKGEAERFVAALTEIASENNWSGVRLRRALESKLSQRAKNKYFEGLGNDETLSIGERLQEFVRLFTRKPLDDELQDIFHACVQRSDESVISYKVRLSAASLIFQKKLNNQAIYEDFLLNQFKRGLLPQLRVEVLKLGSRSFKENVEHARRMEEVYKTCKSGSKNVSAVEEEDARSESLSRQVAELKLQVTRMGTERKDAVRQISSTSVCSFCGKIGHEEATCRIKERAITSLRFCTFCDRIGHSIDYCRVNPNAKFKMRPRVAADSGSSQSLN